MATAGAGQDPLVGVELNERYQIQSRLGEGSMGAVYKATDRRDGALVAVKVLRPDLHDPDRRERLIRRFERETVATLSLDHPNIVRVIDFGRGPFGLFLVLEYLQGRTLREVLEKDKVLPPDRVAKIAFQVALALVDAHRQGIVHRDLKPENIFVCPELGDPDIIKVVDFGIARMPESKEEATQVTQVGSPLGTPRYMSPEQAQAREVTYATDFYSLGVMIFEMLTGNAPFHGNTDMMTAIMHINEPPPPLNVPGLEDPGDLERWRALVTRLLAKAPDARPKSAGELARLIEPLLPDTRTTSSGLHRRPTGAYAKGLRHSQARMPVVPRPGTGLSGRAPTSESMLTAPPPGKRRTWLWLTLGAVLLGGAGAAVYFVASAG